MSKLSWNYLKPGLYREEWKGHNNGLLLNWINDIGLTLNFYLNGPTQQEQEAISSGSRFELAFKVIDDIGFFAFKFGTLDWCDCYFSPNLRGNLATLENPKQKETYILHILLVDTNCGELKFIRSITLEPEFSRIFSSWSEEVLKKEITKDYYNYVIRNYIERYKSASELAADADYKWLLAHGEDQKKRETLEKE